MEIEQPAFVLHARPYRETSALVTFFTPEHGKINGVVKGVRGGRKSALQKAASIQPFQQVNLQWRDKPAATSDLVSIKQLEPQPLRFPLQAESNVCGLYLNEILYRLLYPRVAQPKLFEVYQKALYELLASENRSQQAWALRQFEFQLLSQMGHGLVCDEDAEQRPIQKENDYFYYPQYGTVQAEVDPQKLGVLIKGDCLLNLMEGEFNQECLATWKRLLRATLAEYLGDKPIKTRELFR